MPLEWKPWGHRIITGEARGLGPTIARAGLTVASWGYGAGVGAIRAAYAVGLCRPQRLPRPVVSIGNLTWGGTGKTPVTAHLARALAQRSVRVAILTRGYGADEPQVLRRLAPGIPVVVGRDRVAAGRQAIADGADLLMMDDGFQHWRLHRDLDILLVDATAPFGYGRMIPRGSLREPVTHLRRAQVIIVTRAEVPTADVEGVIAQVRAIHPGATVLTARARPTQFEEWPTQVVQPLNRLQGLRVCALSGIGNPAAFEAVVAQAGAAAALASRFPDPHPYQPRDLEQVAAQCRAAGISWIVTTLKDAGRLPPPATEGSPGGAIWSAGLRIAVLHITMELTGESELLQRLTALRAR